ncbi:MAG TPA: hypothetical protein VGE40_04170 [Bacilli bacterium]
MMILSKAIKIHLRNKSIIFDDIIELENDQILSITNVSSLETERQWFNAEPNEAVKILLTKTQKQKVLSEKQKITEGHTVHSLMSAKLIRLTDHAAKRIATRIDGRDPDSAPSVSSILGIIDIILNSEEVETEARWKGHSTLSYSFRGECSGKKCGVSLAFQSGIMIITITTDADENNTTYYSLGSLLSSETINKLKNRLRNP